VLPRRANGYRVEVTESHLEGPALR